MPRGFILGLIFVLALRSPAARGDILYVSDAGTGAISTVCPEGSTTGGTTFASGFYFPYGIAFDTSGNLYVANTGFGEIDKVSRDGSGSIVASGFGLPYGLAFDTSGNLYVADGYTGKVNKVAPDGSVCTFACGFGIPFGLTFDTSGNLYVSDSLDNYDGAIYKVAPDGTVNPFVTGLNGPSQMAFDSSGNLYVAEYYGQDLLQITPDGSVYLLADGFSGRLSGLAIDSNGTIYVSETDGFTGTIYTVDYCGCVNTFATGFQDPEFIAFGPQTASPEPSSIALLGTVSAVAALYGWRRRARLSRASLSKHREGADLSSTALNFPITSP